MKRRGWVRTATGSLYEVPEPLLDEEEITWPPTLPEKLPSGRTPMISDADFYRRHEIVEGTVYLYLRNSTPLEEVPSEVIEYLIRTRAG